MNRVKHRQLRDDKNRAILTDLIPYEVPLRFSFYSLFKTLKTIDSSGTWISRTFNQRPRKRLAYIPYCYPISHGEGKVRRLGLIHPSLFNEFGEFYSRYNDVILNLCSKSNWSLRRPYRVAKTYYVNAYDEISPENTEPNENPENIPAVEEDEASQKYSSSYFSYRPFNLLQKFFTSKDLILIEREFSSYRRFDIARCFDNIYTHSVSWAVKGKKFGKHEKELWYTFDAIIDSLMQRSCHGETHGILIGPEVSRIYAEIILQAIDVKVASELALLKFIDGRDFVARRYLDDYFVFFNNEQVAECFRSTLERQLSTFKLFLNESKTETITRPFSTNITVAKTKIRKPIKELLSFPKFDENPPPRIISLTSAISEIRLILTEQGVGYNAVSSQILKQIFVILRASRADITATTDIRNLFLWLECAINIAFFIFSVDTRFRTSVLLGRILLEIKDSRDRQSPQLATKIKDAVLREANSFLIRTIKTHSECSLEAFNLLICLKDFNTLEGIPGDLLEHLWNLKSQSHHEFDYFCSLSVIYFMGTSPCYQKLRDRIITGATGRILGAEKLRSDCELFCFALDILSCPWVETVYKAQIAEKLMKELDTPNPSPTEIGAFVNEYKSKTWFFDWSDSVPTSSYLKKKELSLSY